MSRKKKEAAETKVTVHAVHVERREIKQHLKCMLTEPELLKAGKDMADAQNELLRIEEEMDNFKSQQKAKTAVAEGNIGRNASMIRSGYEYRDVVCEEIRNFDEGSLTVRRLDTREILESRLLTTDEMQMALDLQIQK